MAGTLTAQQIVTQAVQIAKVRNYTQQAGVQLNSVLANLCRNYDFELAKGAYSFPLGGTTPGYNGAFAQAVAANPTIGPYFMPADWLRAARDDVFYVASGVPYSLINISNAEFDKFVQQSGVKGFPAYYTIDTAASPEAMFMWPGANGGWTATVRYYRQMAAIVAPETSATIPWFPDEDYLITATAARMFRYAGDETRAQAFDARAKDILMHYLKMKDDTGDRVARVTLDRRFFGSARDVPNTKSIGW